MQPITLPASFRVLRTAVACLGLAASTAWAQAPIQIEQPWARASVPGQQASGGFLRITAQEPMRLVGVSTPAAGHSELHEMRMEGDVMRMRAIDGLDLPAGQTVALQPGGHHLMFMQLAAPLQEGSEITVTLKLQDAQGQPHEHSLQMPVQRFTPKKGQHADHDEQHHGH